MKLYLLVEGKCEAKILPHWLTHCCPQLTRVGSPADPTPHSYYLFNAKGFPSIIARHLPNAVAEVNALGFYDYLVVFFDVDQATVAQRKKDTMAYLAQHHHQLVNTRLMLCLQDCCLETWLLGNRRLYKRNPASRLLRTFNTHYNVAERDPEAMPCFPHFPGERQQFHKRYFRLLAQERHVKTSEAIPGPVTSPEYFEQLRRRFNETGHLESFGTFLRFFEAREAELTRTLPRHYDMPAQP